MVIANSKIENVLEKIINFENIGTFFAPQTSKQVKSLKRWIAFGIQTKGSIIIDAGAEEAVGCKGKSILPVGVTKVEGKFSKGDTLKVFSKNGELVAKGISNFSDEEINKIKGLNEKKIKSKYGSDMCSEIIHRDSLVVFREIDN